MCRDLGVTVLYMSNSGLDCLIEGGDLGRNDAWKALEGQLQRLSLTVLYLSVSGLDFFVYVEFWA